VLNALSILAENASGDVLGRVQRSGVATRYSRPQADLQTFRPSRSSPSRMEVLSDGWRSDSHFSPTA
jgi:hypothetical protein